jgi:hypothetical protein
VSDDEVGLVLVGLTVFFAVLGYLLSRQGLNEVKTATQQVQQAANTAKQTTASAQVVVVDATGPPAASVAQSSKDVADATTKISDQLGQVNEALAGLTGRQAPARVAWALAALTLVGAFISFDLISVAISPDATAPGSG